MNPRFKSSSRRCSATVVASLRQSLAYKVRACVPPLLLRRSRDNDFVRLPSVSGRSDPGFRDHGDYWRPARSLNEFSNLRKPRSAIRNGVSRFWSPSR